MKNIQLDTKNRKILYYLDLNSREPNSIIAKKTGLSKEVVAYRIKKLEESGIIQGYYTIIDFGKLGYRTYRVYLKLIDCSPQEQEKIIDYMIELPLTMWVAEVEGPYDISFSIIARSDTEFREEYGKIRQLYKSKMACESISIFTKAHHFHRAYLLNKKTDEVAPEIFEEGELIEHDEADKKILSLMAKNSRISAVELAQKLKLTDRAIIYRIRSLEKKKIIQGYRFICDFQKYGYEYYKVDITLKDLKRINELKGFAQTHPNILYVDETIGGSDFECDMEVESKEEFIKIIKTLREKFSEIRDWKYFTLNKYRKMVYYPGG